jgi:hypothetical protein
LKKNSAQQDGFFGDKEFQNKVERVIEQFLEYRGRGVSLSGKELEIALLWEKNNIQEEFILVVMAALFEESLLGKKTFPASLLSINRILEKKLQKSFENQERRSSLR